MTFTSGQFITFTNKDEVPDTTIMVEDITYDAKGNVISSSVRYESTKDVYNSEGYEVLGMKNSPKATKNSAIEKVLSIVEFVFYVILMIGVCNKFDKSLLFAIGVIILPFIFLPILALGDASYYG